MCNSLLNTDVYKLSHYLQYKPNTQTIYSYFESRGGEFEKTLFFGLQYLLKKHLVGKVVTQEKIDEAEEISALCFNNNKIFNKAGWQYILDKYDGRLPIKIKAIPEGSLIPTSNVLMTVENTDPKCYWLTNYLETLLVQVWYPTTVATQSYYMKKTLAKYLSETGSLDGIEYRLHDFGCRGSTSMESAGIGGCAHLVNFYGTDTLPALSIARKYYHSHIAGFSIPAAEHSTITSWGREHEIDAMKNMLDKYPTGLVAVVSDSFNIFEACKNIWGDKLRQQILDRDGILVVRPDTGDPCLVLPKLLSILADKFGCVKNNKGYLELNPKIRLIQGDGIDKDSIGEILRTLQIHGWSANNISFGSGGGLLQKINRDTCRFAFKCSAATIDNQDVNVYKEPITDISKKSKKGRFKLVLTDEGYKTVNIKDCREDCLVEVFNNGVLLQDYTLDDIRNRSKTCV